MVLCSWLYLIENNILVFLNFVMVCDWQWTNLFKWKLQIINHYSSDNMKRIYFLCFLIQIITNIFHCSRSLMRVNVFVNKVLKHPVLEWGPLLNLPLKYSIYVVLLLLSYVIHSRSWSVIIHSDFFDCCCSLIQIFSYADNWSAI